MTSGVGGAPLVRRLGLPPPPWIVGHRGAAGEALENTVESFRLAAAQGADMVELDLQLTADGGLVAFHDWSLERLAGEPTVVEEASAARLAGVSLRDAAGGRSGAIPTLGDVLSTLPPELPLNLELKRRTAGRRRFADRLAAAVDGRDRLLVSSFDWPLLAAFRRAAPRLPVAPLAERGARDLLEAGRELGASALHIHRRLARWSPFRRSFFRRAADDGRPVLVYTVNRERTARRLSGRGAAGLFTDFPGRLREELEVGR